MDVTTIAVAVITGLTSAAGTIAALRVHIMYLKERSEKNESAIVRAHERIDTLEKRLHC